MDRYPASDNFEGLEEWDPTPSGGTQPAASERT
jgi:hypothetical protein